MKIETADILPSFRPDVRSAHLAAAFIFVLLSPSLSLAQQDSPDEQILKTQTLLQQYSSKVGEPRSLDDLLEFALNNAPTMLAARERVGLGEAQITDAKRFQTFNPELEVEAGLPLEQGGLDRAEVTLKQRFELAGERGLRIEAARREKRAFRAELERVNWRVHAEAHRLYRLGRVGRERLSIQLDILDFTQRLFQIAQQRYQAGEVPRTSVIVARAELASARQKVVQTWIRYIERLRDLGEVIGWSEDTPPQPIGELDETRPIPERDQLIETALQEDTELALLDMRLAQARAQLALREREVWPNPMLGIGWEGEGFASGDSGNTVRIVVGVPLPLWNRNQGEIAGAKTRAEIIQQAIENRRQVLETRVIKQAESVEATHQQARIFEQEVLPALEMQLGLLEEGFQLGELSLLDVMSARDRLMAVQRQYLTALEGYYVAVSKLEDLLGTSIWDNP